MASYEDLQLKAYMDVAGPLAARYGVPTPDPVDPSEIPLNDVLDVRTANQLEASWGLLFVDGLFKYGYHDFVTLPNVGWETARKIEAVRKKYLAAAS